MDARRAFGDRGEAVAEAYLLKKGYRVLARQFRTRFGEIDLVAQDGDEVVFVEVKARKTSYFGYPEESVNSAKRRKMFKTAEAFLSTLDQMPDYRFDVVAVEYETIPPTVTHYPNIEMEV